MSPPGPPSPKVGKVTKNDMDEVKTGRRKRMVGTEFKWPKGEAEKRVTRRSLWNMASGSASGENLEDETQKESESPSPDPGRIKAKANFTLKATTDGTSRWRTYPRPW